MSQYINIVGTQRSPYEREQMYGVNGETEVKISH